MFLRQLIKADPVKSSILPTDITPRKTGYNSKRLDNGHPSRLGKRLYEMAAEGVLLDYDGKMILVHCKEHDRHEVIFALNYHYDLSKWYTAGVHPRFSIAKALLEAKQTFRELENFIGSRASDDQILPALNASKTQEQFLETMKPHLFTTLRIGRRRIRIPHRTKEKFEAKSFTVNDFLSEENQEMRRVIARIIPVKEVLKRMKRVVKDEEGTLYDYTIKGRQSWQRTNRRYLHVTCPSTAQEYLLEVPERFDKPKEARRWTFNLPAEAEFAKEA